MHGAQGKDMERLELTRACLKSQSNPDYFVRKIKVSGGFKADPSVEGESGEASGTVHH
jgi:hypothetical protein